jgi:hypothetical protein
VVVVRDTGHIPSIAFIILSFGTAANVALEKGEQRINGILEIRKRYFVIFPVARW